jgi:hypothetical protein
MNARRNAAVAGRDGNKLTMFGIGRLRMSTTLLFGFSVEHPEIV